MEQRLLLQTNKQTKKEQKIETESRKRDGKRERERERERKSENQRYHRHRTNGKHQLPKISERRQRDSRLQLYFEEQCVFAVHMCEYYDL